MIWVALICLVVVVISAVVVFSNDAYKKGKIDGEKEFWEKLGHHIEHQKTLTMEFKNAKSGLKLSRVFEILEVEKGNGLKGSLEFSKEEGGEIQICLLKDFDTKATLIVPADKVPKSLHGKNISGELLL